MNWFKRKFESLFTYEEIEENNSDVPFSVEDEMDETKMDVEEAEKETSESSESRQGKNGFFDQMKFNDISSTSFYPDQNVYDIETPRISELLANRGKHVKTERVIRSHYEETRQTPPINKTTRKTEYILAEYKEELPRPPQNKRRFTPTNVPSPVYGFAKRDGIHSLLTTRNSHEEKTLKNSSQMEDKIQEKNYNTIISREISTSTHVNAETAESNSENIIKKEVSTETQVTQLERQVIEDYPLNELDGIEDLAETTIEKNNTEELEKVAPTQWQDDSSEDQTMPLNTATANPQQIKEGSKIPFNVIMLKSDKEKWQAKNIQQNVMTNDTLQTIFPQQREAVATIDHETIEILTNDMIEEIASDEPIKHTTELIETLNQGDILDLSVEQFNHNHETVSNAIELSQSKNTTQQLENVSYYVKPSIDLLEPPEQKTEDIEWMSSQAEKLVEALSYFQVTAQVESILQGPAVTQFEITVSQGTKVSKIRNLSDDLKLALAAKDIRIQAPIPGKSSIGIEIPNRQSRAVRLSEVINSDVFKQSESPLEAALGLDLTGQPVTIDLCKMPHGLIAGATGSGKSVCINSLLVSLLYKSSPSELKLMLIDPKVVELAPFNHIPHLVSPVITDVKAATAALKWAVEEMERRYQLFAEVGVRALPRYNELAESKGQYHLKLPYILIVIDELADLMMMAPADVEESICRIAQKARACGIHLIVATQRPSVDVITGLIKSNIPTRIAFAVSSQIDSRTILDSQGAERLLGRGDMLYLGNGMSDSIRIQGTFVTDDEIEEVLAHVRHQGKPDYFFDQEELLKKAEVLEEQDDLFEDVCRFVYEQGSASTSSIQRKYHIGYNRAARLVDMLEQNGFVSEQRGSKARDVYITESDLTNLFD